MAPGGTAADSWGPWIGPRYGSSSGEAAEPRRGARFRHGGSHAREEGARYAGPNLGGCTRTRRHSRATGAAATARNSGAVESPAAGAAAPRMRWSASNAAAAPAQRQRHQGAAQISGAVEGISGANLGPDQSASGTRARQPRPGPVELSASAARWIHQGAAAAEARARWRPPGSGSRTSGAMQAPGQQPSPGRGSSRAPGAVEAPGRSSRSSGAWSTSAARWRHPGRGGGHRARQPSLGPVERTGAPWRAPGHGSRSSGAKRISGAVEGTRGRQPSLGPVARISGAVEHQGTAAEPRARWRRQGAAAAEARARGAHWRRDGGTGARQPKLGRGWGHRGMVEGTGARQPKFGRGFRYLSSEVFSRNAEVLSAYLATSRESSRPRPAPGF